MKGLRVKQLTESALDSLEVVDDLEKPSVGARDLLVRVKAVATNPVDSIVTQYGRFLGGVEAVGSVVGWDAAGVVEEVGADVKNFKAGDEVYFAGDVKRNGCFAQYTAVDERIAAAKPSSLSFAEAAALPLTALTAWEAIGERMGAPADASANKEKAILIINGSGGVGSIAVQLARKVFGFGTVVATASRDETIAWAKDFGATHVINHHKELQPQLKEAGIEGVDYIFCCTQAEKSAAQWSSIINVFAKACLISGTVDGSVVNDFRGKCASVHNELMFTRIAFDAAPEEQGKILTRVAALVDEKELRTTADKSFKGFEGILEALKLQASGKAKGKSVIDLE